jgi:hypothetical protein
VRLASTTSTQPRAARLARKRRAVLRKRARRIRRTVAGLAAALFCTAFLVIYVQLASGHDPALLANAKRAASASARSTSAGSESTNASSESTSAGSESTSASGSAGGESSTSSSSSSSEQTSTGATAVRTAQS